MAVAFQDTDAIKLALFDELQKILSPDHNIRTKAEERLNQMKVTDGYGVYLAEMILDTGLDLGLRQLASVMLKQYVEESWMFNDEPDGKLHPLASDQAKKMIKSILPEGLYDPNSKIRSAVAYTISAIASFDWPNDWGELFEIIVKCLNGGNENSVHGAMQVLVEFTYELNTQIIEVGPLILSEVYRIFEADGIYNTKTRACAVEILHSVLKSINLHAENKQQIKDMINPTLTNYVQKLIAGLTAPLGKQSSFKLKMEIVKVLTYMVAEMPKFIHPYLPSILNPIWTLLTQMADVYIKVIVNNEEESPFDTTQEEDQNEEFIKMILQVFEFVHSIVESKKFKQNVSLVLTDLIYIIIIYMQMTEEQGIDWQEDSEKFVEDEDEQGVNYSVRTSGQDILAIIGEEFGDKVLPALSDALTKHVAVADANRAAGQLNWWKIHEASMLAVGSYKALIESNEGLFNLGEYLNLVRGLLQYDVSPYLTGRCLWILARYVDSKIYNVQMMMELIGNIQKALSPEQQMVLKICATRSVYGICTNLQNGNEEQRQCLSQKLVELFDGIFPIIQQSQNTVLGLILETVAGMLSFDSGFTAQISAKVIPLSIAIFLKYHDDRYILDSVQDIMKILSQNPYCSQPLQEKLVPTLVSILNLQGEQTNSAMQDIALNVLETIVKYSQTPLSDALMDTAFPAAVHCILRTEDHSVIQSGGECLRAYLFVSPEQVCRYKNGEGLNWVMQITTMLLNPMNTEFTATFIGRLVITIITKAGSFLGEHIDLLLKAVISKMQLVQALSVMMSLVMTFAHLILIQMDAVLNFLSTVPGPTGEPAMNFVLTNWLNRQHLFYGQYERKVSIMALCKLFEYGISTNDSRLTSVQIKELQPIPGANVKTRAQTQTNQHWVNVPCLVKIFKLLLNELNNIQEVREADQSTEETEDESEVDDLLNTSANGKNFSAMMLYEGEEETDEDDEQMMAELMQDPIFQGNMEETLTKFIQNFSQKKEFELFKPMLSEFDMSILQSINVPTV
uniref:CSON015154 protein n=1 Tax=Culicoides sonorensis TaxID=179676 RepID=A0A336MGN8_CULSO